MTSPWSVPIFLNLTIPSTAGPGNARIVIASQLPPPLDTYVFYGDQTYAGALIFYAQGSDQDYTYLGVVEDIVDSDISIHVGHVLNGTVVEISVGVPAVQRWLIEQATGQQTFEIYSHDFTNILSLNAVTVRAGGPNGLSLLATGAGGDITGSAIDGISFDAGGNAAFTRAAGTQGFFADNVSVAMVAGGALQNALISATNLAQVSAPQVNVLGPANVDTTWSGAGIVMRANNAGNDIAFQAQDQIRMTAGTEVRVQADLNVTLGMQYQLDASNLWVTTKKDYQPANALVALGAAFVLVPGCTFVLTPVRNNPNYEVEIVCDFEETAAGATVCLGQLFINGVAVAGQALLSVAAVGDRATVPQNYAGALVGAGPFTFELRVSRSAAAGAQRANAIHSTIRGKLLEQ